MTWQPIETAPRGKKVLVYGVVPGYSHSMTTVARFWGEHTLEVAEDYEGEDWVDRDENGIEYMPADWYEENHGEGGPMVNLKPTHWMPLPEAPK